MAYPLPPQIEVAIDQLKQAIKSVDQKDVDVLKTPWPELEQSVIKLFGGKFQMNQPQHQAVAAGLAGILGARLIEEFKAFWFPNRDSLEGAGMGFPEELIMLSPFGAVADALNSGNLAKLDALIADIRRSLAQSRFAPRAPGQMPQLGPEDYQRLFDPGFLHFAALETSRAKTVWDNTPTAVVREVRDALGRAGALPKEAKAQMDGQIAGALGRLDPAKPLMQQVEQAPRVIELLTHLYGTTDGTGFAPEEFWVQVVLPLLYIGAPAQFPPLDDDELDAFKQGADPLALFVDVVPYQTPAEEDGLLGALPMDQLQLLHPDFARGGAIRLVQMKTDVIGPLLEKFDPAKSRETVARFVALLEEKAGQKSAPPPQGQPSLSDAAFALLTDLKRAAEVTKAGTHVLTLRRVTEAEAASEQALGELRKALRAPRIILT
ncbi:MAG TPA: hypothetical protein VK447_07670 [Myxococcaceae bacterium]|nr:hypothetical protein [Myxococcaceae bacterium]